MTPVLALAVAFAFLVVIPDGNLLLSVSLPSLFSCHPSPQAEDLLLLLPLLLPFHPQDFLIQLIMSDDAAMPVAIRPAEQSDIPAMASIRGKQWETESYWQHRITAYLAGELFPQQALAPRAAFIAADGEQIVGFVAGHLTRRYQCDAEVEWIDTIEERRRQGIAGALLRTMTHWFLERNARKVCVDPGNDIARAVYAKYGARPLNQHWMVWDDISILTNSPQQPPFAR